MTLPLSSPLVALEPNRIDSYADASGNLLTGAGGSSVGIAEYIGPDGLEELHCFLGLGWFDTGSWAWGHYIAEWGTKGIFQVSVTIARRLVHTQLSPGR